MSIIDELITDRTQSDVTHWKELHDKGWVGMTDEEKAEWNTASMKGAYNYTDLNRVVEAMDYLNNLFAGYGYSTGYKKIIAHPEEPETESYTQLEWVKFSGSQYIDTGVHGTKNTKIVTNFRNEQDPNSAIFGADGGWTVNGFGVWVNPQIIAPVFGSQSGNVSLSFSSNMDEISLDSTGVLFNGDHVWTVDSENQFTTPTNILIGAVNRSGTPYELFIGVIGKTQISESNSIIRNYIPVQNSSGSFGFYDTVNNLFTQSSLVSFSEGGPIVPGSPDIPSPTPPKGKYTWAEEDVPTASQMSQHIANVNALRNTIAVLSTTPATPESMELLDYINANSIEQILINVNHALTTMAKTFIPCGFGECGEEYI